MIIGICDDERSECVKIKDFVEKTDFYEREKPEIVIYEPDEFLAALSAEDEDRISHNNRSDGAKETTVVKNKVHEMNIMIMDIEFVNVDYDGISLAKKLNEIRNNCQIIYLTHILEFAPEVYDTDHCYFVMKNNMEVMLVKALEKAAGILRSIELQKPIEVSSGGHVVYIPQQDILYIEKKQRQTVIHTLSHAYPCYESISAFTRRVSDAMVRCHGGYIVNLSHIDYLGSEKLSLNGVDVDIPVGKTYRESVKQAYLTYWMKRM